MPGTAYIFADTFDEYTYNSEQQLNTPSQGSFASEESEILNAAFDINLPTLLECLNILGTAGSAGGSLKPNEKAHRFHRIGEDEDQNEHDEGPSRRTGRNGGGGQASGRLDQYFGSGKGTGMRLSYAGSGYPLTLIM